jgi:hypothetical protein
MMHYLGVGSPSSQRSILAFLDAASQAGGLAPALLRQLDAPNPWQVCRVTPPSWAELSASRRAPPPAGL